MLSRKHNIPEDLRGVDAMLRASRPELPADRMASVATRARARARASILPQTHHKESFLRSRIAITLMLVLGFGFSSAGVGMAVNSIPTDRTTASDAQYDRAPLAPTNQQPTLEQPDEVVVGGETGGGNAPDKSGNGGDVAGESDEEAVAQTENRQLAAEQGAADELPFTGFAAIPVLLMGLALLTAGFTLRRRA